MLSDERVLKIDEAKKGKKKKKKKEQVKLRSESDVGVLCLN